MKDILEASQGVKSIISILAILAIAIIVLIQFVLAKRQKRILTKKQTFITVISIIVLIAVSVITLTVGQSPTSKNNNVKLDNSSNNSIIQGDNNKFEKK